MAQITTATIDVDPLVVIDSDFRITVTFSEDILPETLTHESFSGNFIIDETSKQTVTENTVFTFQGKADTIYKPGKLILNLSAIEDADTETDGMGSVEQEIEVINKPDFEMYANQTKRFTLSGYFKNPIDADLTIMAASDWMAPDHSQIAFDGNMLTVTSPTQGDQGTDFLSNDDEFSDVVVRGVANNTAGEASYTWLLRVKSAKPTAIERSN